MRWFEYAYIILVVFGSYLFFIWDIKLVTLLVVNGSIVCFTYVIAFPIWLHLKCLLYDKTSGFIEGDE
jgi:hypothetical protein